MARTVQVPDFDFTGFYYAEILEALIQWLRTNVPEVTNEDPAEPAVQLLRAYALIGHLNNVLLDLGAHEALLPTAQLRDSIVQHLALIGFTVAGDVPSVAEVVLTLSKTFTSAYQVVPDHSLFSTKRISTEEPIIFEANGSLDISRSDQITKAFVYDTSGPTWTEVTTQINTDLAPVAILPATPAPGDAFYIGHDSVLTNRMRASLVSVPMDDVFGVWEYGDNEWSDDSPNTIQIVGSQLKIVIDSMLGTDGSIDYSGLTVKVVLNATGASETLVSDHDGSHNYILTASYLGQTSPSTTPDTYTVGSLWHRLPGLDDDTNAGSTTLEQDGDIDFLLPKTQDEDWQLEEVNSSTIYWLRFRVVSVGGSPVPATLDRIYWNRRDNFVQVECTQGQTRNQDPLGSSDGSANQEFQLGASPVIPGTVAIVVNSVLWEEVDSFLNSTSVDRHYRVMVDSEGNGTVVFGDGINGQIPPIGVNNVSAEYRTDAELDGNVGSNSIVVNRSGLANVKAVSNPRPASGWVQRRGATEADRELLKLEGPASLRVLERAVSPYDVEYLATHFVTAAGSRPFKRAKAVEEAAGLKTVSVYLVGSGGAIPTLSDIAELSVYLNGDLNLGTPGVMVANQRAWPSGYNPYLINVTAIVTGGSKQTIETALQGLLSPVALLEDGFTYRWAFGQTVARNKIIATIFAADSDVTDVNLIDPVSNVPLNVEQLPALGTLSILVI